MRNRNRDPAPEDADAARRRRPSFAVIGSGIAGLTAAHVLSATGDVSLYEADDRLGGHAHTHELAAADGTSLTVDSGFIVYNERTYPFLTRLFAELDVTTRATEMSMSVRCDGCGLEYAGGRGARGLFAAPGTATRPAYLRMLASVPRFHRAAHALLANESDCTLGEFLREQGFSPYFARHFALPLVSTVWSCPGALAAHYPARHLFRFLANHGMLSVTGAPTWRTVVGGSRRYVERVAKGLHRVLVSAPVRAVVRHADGVDVHDHGGGVRRYDGVVVAAHPAQALALLDGATAAERNVLGAFRYERSSAVLHTDASLLPTRAHASWNCRLPTCTTSAAGVRVGYDMNRLQNLPGSTRYVVTLNDDAAIDPAAIVATMTYEHPVFTVEAVAAQRRLPELDRDRVAFAGAYHGWGFHEDGCRAGVAAARSLGGTW